MPIITPNPSWRSRQRGESIEDVHLLQAKHFVQEERPSDVAALILELAR